MAPLQVALGTKLSNPLALPLAELNQIIAQEKEALVILIVTKDIQDLT
jgi:hypothetical protein